MVGKVRIRERAFNFNYLFENAGFQTKRRSGKQNNSGGKVEA